MELSTPRLHLRPFRESDAEDLFDYARDIRVGPIAGWPPHESIEESRRIIATVFAKEGVFAMEDKASGRVIGSVGFVDGHPAGVQPHCPDDEIGYALHPAFWGRGLTPEAVRAVLEYGFAALGLERVWCGHYAGNWRSCRCVQKCGFRYQFSRSQRVELLDETRECCYYLLTKEAWRERVSGAV